MEVKSVLEKVKISEYSEVTGPGTDYTLDMYVGCEHACKYCYVFRNQFVDDPKYGSYLWGDFVDPKINAPEVLANELKTVKRGVVLLSSLTDPYQPLEYNYRITRRCLEVLLKAQFRVVILTKSNLVARDMDLLTKFQHADVGFSISTNDDDIRQLIEPNSSSIEERINTLKTFHSRKIQTYVHIGPILPMDPGELVDMISDHVDYAIIDRMNYITPELEDFYTRNGFSYALGDEYFKTKEAELRRLLERKNIRVW